MYVCTHCTVRLAMATQELDPLIEDTTKQSLDATERIVAIAEETHKTAGNIVVNLEQQGEQIEKLLLAAEEVHEDVHETKRDVSKLGCFSCFFYALRIRPRFRKPKKSSPNAHRKSDHAENGHMTLAEGPIIKRSTNDPTEDRIDENLR